MAWLRIVVSYVAFGFAWPVLTRHAKLQRRRQERWARYAQGFASHPAKAGRVWLHGASAGDVLALVPTARALKAAQPDVQLVVSALTDAGITLAQDSLLDIARVVAMPWDVPHVARRAMSSIKPDVLVLEYAELWPNLLASAHTHHVPVVLHNGRLSPSFVRRYRALFLLAGHAFRQLRLLLMRDESEAQRARALGAAPERIVVAGNTKVDHCHKGPAVEVVASLRRILRAEPTERLWVAGSTHVGEEEHVLLAQRALNERLSPPPRLVLAPRYPERAAELVAMAEQMGLVAEALSDVSAASRAPGSVIVIDRVGMLFAAYALARVVFVGGTFVPRGGQNMLEPASLGVPVLYGPSTENFVEAVGWLREHGGTSLRTPQELLSAVEMRLTAAQTARAEGARARAAVFRHSGVAARNAAAILALCRSSTMPANGARA